MKTIIVKQIAALMGLAILFTNISAQNDAGKKGECDAYINPSTYIFQGKIISSKLGVRRKVSEHKYLNFNSYIVEVDEILRGSIQKGTIEIITGVYGIGFEDSGKIQHYIAFDRDPSDIIPPNEGIYFFNEKEVDIKSPSIDNTNGKSLQFWSAIPLSNGELKKETRGITQYFSTLSDFYNYISENYGINVSTK
jgi:hypothetical protein